MTSHCEERQNHAERGGNSAVRDCHKTAAIPNEALSFKTSCLRRAGHILNADRLRQDSWKAYKPGTE